jgi:hypothetical protein
MSDVEKSNVSRDTWAANTTQAICKAEKCNMPNRTSVPFYKLA